MIQKFPVFLKIFDLFNQCLAFCVFSMFYFFLFCLINSSIGQPLIISSLNLSQMLKKPYPPFLFALLCSLTGGNISIFLQQVYLWPHQTCSWIWKENNTFLDIDYTNLIALVMPLIWLEIMSQTFKEAGFQYASVFQPFRTSYHYI